jgi:hypothetical protein
MAHPSAGRLADLADWAADLNALEADAAWRGLCSDQLLACTCWVF